MTHAIRTAPPVAMGRVLRWLVVTLVVALAMVVATEVASAQNVERSGKQVVEASCFACHGSGANGAPKIGDKQAQGPVHRDGRRSATRVRHQSKAGRSPLSLCATGVGVAENHI